ncbi:MAG TPA: DUF2505 domain-containing protein [Myxococcota bacterium]|nr:DUF2505 domain-containing protein [Myxococcota bacterium]
MKLRLVSELPGDPALVWDVFEGEEFQRRLDAQTGLRTEVIDVRQEGTVTIRRLRYASRTELPAVVARALGSSTLSYEQENRLDSATSRLTWVVKIPVLGDRVKASGTTVITPAGAGSRREVEGDVSIAIPLIGGQIEKVIAGEFEKSMGRAVEIARALLDERLKG